MSHLSTTVCQSKKKKKKREFYKNSITFLGYVHKPSGVEMEQAKVNAIQQWPQPQNIK